MGCCIGFVMALAFFVPASSRTGPAFATIESAANAQQLPEPTDPFIDSQPCDDQDPLLPSSVDFGLVDSTETSVWGSNGSFVLRYKFEDGNKLEIVMVGPDDGPEEDPPGHVLWGLNPNHCDDYRKMNRKEILKFISKRLKNQHNITPEEAGYLSTLLVYTHKLVRVKRWEIGIKHFREGEWYKVFERPDKASFGSYPEVAPK